MRFRNFSIQQKLMVMSLAATGAALILAVLAFMSYDFVTYRSSLVRRLGSLTDIIGLNMTSALVFQDPAAATKTLESLKVRMTMRSAAVYSPDGRAFAFWGRKDEVPPVVPSEVRQGKPYHAFTPNRLTVFRPIIFEGTSVGIVSLSSSLSELATRLKNYALIALGVISTCFIVAVIFSVKIGQRFLEPIFKLTETAEHVAREKDYSVRAPRGSPDEIGNFIVTFNDMLAKIQTDEQERNSAAEEIRELNEGLEQKVSERTRELTAANKELEAFSYSVSHDLRTPLRAIDGFSKELLENASQTLDDHSKSDLQRIRNATFRMSELIDSLLKLSRLTRIDMKREDVDLSAQVEKVVQDLRTAFPQREVEVRITPHVTASGNGQLLLAAFENLIGNAWKFTAKRSPGIIEFGHTTNEEGKDVYFVKDNGVGFNMAYASKLFGAFQRFHESKDYPGTGVGLATVQRIIHRHGGKIWADAKVNHGATFYFTLT